VRAEVQVVTIVIYELKWKHVTRSSLFSRL